MTPEEGYKEALRRINKAARTDETELVLSGLNLKSVPPEIGSLLKLTHLDLADNQLTGPLSQICSLTNLRHLGLAANQLKELSPMISRLAALQSVDLTGNQLTALPPEIGALTSLDLLYLDGNQLTTLPAEMENLIRLTELYVKSNPFLPPFSQLTEFDELADEEQGGVKAAMLRKILDARPLGVEEDGADSEYVSGPDIPQQAPAPVSAEIRNARVSRKHIAPENTASSEEDHQRRMFHERLKSECIALKAHGGNNPGYQELLDNYAADLGQAYDDLNVVGLGFWGAALQQTARRTDEFLEPDVASRVNGFYLNHELFINQFKEWRAFKARALEAAILAEQSAAALPATRCAIREMERASETVDAEVTTLLDKLRLALQDAQAFDPQSAYGFYQSLENVLVVLAHAAAGPAGDFAKKALDDAHGFAAGAAGKGLVVGAVGLLGAMAGHLLGLADELPLLFGWVPALLRYLGVGV